MATKIPTKRDGNSGLLDEGVYLLRVEDAEERTSPNSGNEYLQLRMVPLVNGEPRGRSIWDILSFQETARFKFDQIFDAMDVPEDMEVTAAWFIGKRVYAIIKKDEYQGNLKNVVKTYVPEDKARELIAKQKEGSEQGSLDFEDSPIERASAKRNGSVSGNGRRTKNRPADVEDDEDAMPM